MAAEQTPDPLVLADLAAWHEWLMENEGSSDGVWLMLAKKGKVAPTTLTYQEALEEALCGGWIDGQRRTLDELSFRQRFTPRRARSLWSQRNVELIARLATEGRLREGGVREVDRARADGRWGRAYAGPATAEAPAELTAALAASPSAEAAFARLGRTARYWALHPILTAPSEATAARRIASLIARLETERAPSPALVVTLSS